MSTQSSTNNMGLDKVNLEMCHEQTDLDWMDAFFDFDAYEKDVLTARNADESPLLKLPAGIRNNIYRLIFDQMQYRVADSSECIRLISNGDDIRPAKHAVALLQTCRQLYKDTRLLPFTHGTLVLHKMRTMVQILSDIPSYAADNLASLSIHLRPLYERGFPYLSTITSSSETIFNTPPLFKDDGLEVLKKLRGLSRLNVYVHGRTERWFLTSEKWEWDVGNVKNGFVKLKETVQEANPNVAFTIEFLEYGLPKAYGELDPAKFCDSCLAALPTLFDTYGDHVCIFPTTELESIHWPGTDPATLELDID
ncbi:beta transducin [Kalmusia sp. IMI 367209]|nr:beta transducin [Kalmusia sp. IMI 367209]